MSFDGCLPPPPEDGFGEQTLEEEFEGQRRLEQQIPEEDITFETSMLNESAQEFKPALNQYSFLLKKPADVERRESLAQNLTESVYSIEIDDKLNVSTNFDPNFIEPCDSSSNYSWVSNSSSFDA